MKMKNNSLKGPLMIIIAALLLVAVMLILGNQSFKATEKTTFDEFNQRQLVLAQEVTSSIELYFESLAGAMRAMGELPEFQQFDEAGTRAGLEFEFDELQPRGVNDIGVLDANGVLRYNAIAHQIEGTDFSWRAYFQEAKDLPDNETYIVEFIEFKGADAGQKGVLIAVPMFTNHNHHAGTGQFAGVVLCTLKLDVVTQKFIVPIRSSKQGDAFLIDNEYNMLWSTGESLFGKDILTASKEYPAFQQVVENMAAGQTGAAEYTYYKITEANNRHIVTEEERLIAYAPIRLGQDLWAIGVWAPKEDARQSIRSIYFNQLLVVIVSLLAILGGSSYTLFVFARIGRMLEQEVDTKTRELQAYITDLKQAEEALRESEKRYYALFEEAPVMYLTIRDEQGIPIITNCNAIFLTTLGYTRDEVIDCSLAHFYTSKSRAALLEGGGFQNALQGKMRTPVERDLVARDGRIIATLLRAVPEIDETGQNIGTRAMFTNITERKQAEEKVRQQNEFLNNVIESLAHPFYVINANDYTIEIANSAARSLGMTTLETCHALTHQRDKPCDDLEHPCPLVEVKKTKKPAIVEHIHFDYKGNPRNVEIHGFPIFNHQGDVVQMIEYTLDITQRKQAEETLRESEKTAKALLNAPISAVTLIDTKGIILDVNETVARRFHKSIDELIGLSVWDLFPPAVTQRRKTFIDEVIQSGQPLRFEDERQGIWNDNVVYPIFDTEGEVKKIAVFAHNITERKQAEKALQKAHNELELRVEERTAELTKANTRLKQEITERKRAETALRESEERYRTVAETATDAIITIDEENRITFINHAAENIFGYTLAEMLGQPLTMLIPAHLQHPHQTALKQYLDIGQKRIPWQAIELPALHKNGQEIPLEISLGEFNKNGRHFFIGIARDITERKRAETALRESEERYRVLIETMNEGLGAVTRDGVITFVNDSLCEMLEYSRDELIGHPATDFLDKTNQIILKEKMTKRIEGKAEPYEIEWTKKNGEHIHTIVSPQAILDNKGNFTGSFGVITDITERKRAEAAMKQHAQEMSVLNILGRQVSASLFVDQVVAIALEVMINVATPDLALIYLQQKDQLVVQDVYLDTSVYHQDEAILHLGDHLCRLAASQQENVFVGDIRQDSRCESAICKQTDLHSCAALLLQKGDQILGVMGLGWVLPRNFSKEATFLETLTSQIAIGLQNAILYEQVLTHAEKLEQRIADRTRELSALYEVTAVASESLNLKTTLERSLEQVLVAMRSNMGIIHLLGEERERLHLTVQQGLSPDTITQEDTIPLASGLTGWVIEHGEPLVVPNVATDPRTVQMSGIGFQTAYVGVPIRARGRMLGVLGVLKEKEQPPFSMDEVTLLTSIADHVGVVVESARLRQLAQQAAVLEERGRLARELHDSVTQLLYSLALFAKVGQESRRLGDLAQVDGSLTELSQIAQQALKEMRLLVYELRPPALEQDGLVGALQLRLDAVEGRAGVETRLLVDKEVELSEAVEEGFYRVAQEALNNALKHAAATSVTVQIHANDEQAELEVIDNGSGFDPNAVDDGGGLGLVSIRERVEKLDGVLTLLSVPGEGTKVRVRVKTVPNSQEAVDLILLGLD